MSKTLNKAAAAGVPHMRRSRNASVRSPKQEKIRPESDKVLTRILHLFESASTLMFFFMLTLAYFYVIGNLQSFTADTQQLLLSIMRVVGFAALAVNFYALLVIVLWSVRHRHFLYLRFIFSLVSMAIGLGLTLIAGFIGLFVQPDWQGRP